MTNESMSFRIKPEHNAEWESPTNDVVTYSDYRAMSKDDQKEFKKRNPVLYNRFSEQKASIKAFNKLMDADKKEYKELFSKLDEKQKSLYPKYKATVEMYGRLQNDIIALEGQEGRVLMYRDKDDDYTELVKDTKSTKKSVLASDASAKNQMRFEKDRDAIFSGYLTQAEVDNEIDAYFADMDKVIETRPIKKDNYYLEKTFPKPKWDVDVDDFKEYVENDYEVEIRFGTERTKKKGNPYGFFRNENFARIKKILIQERKELNEKDEITDKMVNMEIKKHWDQQSEEVKSAYQEKANETRKYFDSQITKNAFENIMSVMPKVTPIQSTVYSKTDVQEEPVITKDGLPLIKNGKEIKRKYFDTIRIIDDHIERKRDIRNVTSGVWGFRLEASSETQIPTSEIEKYDVSTSDWYVRQRTRWSWDVEDVRVELTKVVNPKDRRNVTYEAEVEILKPAQDFSKQVQEIVLKYTGMMQKGTNILSKNQIDVVRENYNSIFTEFVKEETEFVQPNENDASMGAYRVYDDNILSLEPKLYDVPMVKKQVNPELFISYENKPSSFEYRNIFQGFEYRVTPKLDGVRVRIFHDVNGVFEVDHRSGFVRQLGDADELAGTIIDCEYYEGEYYPFDVLAYKGVNIITEFFDNRMKNIEKIKGYNMTKPFFKGINVWDGIKQAFEWMDKNNEKYDGLILQRHDEEYWKFNYKTKTMKWKPLDEITVDLLTRVGESKVELYSGGDKEYILEYTGTFKDFGIPKKFQNIGDFIGEYNFINNDFKVVFKGVRTDKVEPNFHSVVKSNYGTFFYDKVGKNDLLGDTIQAWRKWASAWKREMIDRLVPEGVTILDIGVGRGGGALFDMSRRASKVYGIDPSKKNLQELRRRLDSDVFSNEEKKKIIVAQLKGQDTNEIENLLDEHVDVITLFFSISFFYESGEDFESLMDTINQCSKKNAMVIVQLMDGDRIFEELPESSSKKRTSVVGKNSKGEVMYKIVVNREIKGKRVSESTQFGVPVSISFPLEEDAIIGETQDEFLASETMLTSRLAKHGFIRQDSEYMDKDAILQTTNLEFARLNRVLVYTRGKGAVKKYSGMFTGYTEEYVEEFMNPLPEDSSDNITIDDKELLRTGVVVGKDSFISSFLYNASSKYRAGNAESREIMILQARSSILKLFDEEIFKTSMSNVEHNIAYDLLYTKVYDTIKDGKQVNIVHNVETAKIAAFNQYAETIAVGWVGHEIADLMGALWNKRIEVYGEDGKLLKVGTPKNTSVVKILKIGDITYEPMK